jgi:hypothetical protein
VFFVVPLLVSDFLSLAYLYLPLFPPHFSLGQHNEAAKDENLHNTNEFESSLSAFEPSLVLQPFATAFSSSLMYFLDYKSYWL